MEKFYYHKGKTKADEVIEHILMRLNTDFEGGSLQVPDFCSVANGGYDRLMEASVRDKMYRFGIAMRSTGQGQPETAIMLTPKGHAVFLQGGWQSYLQQLAAEQEKKNMELARKRLIDEEIERLNLEKTRLETEELVYKKTIRKQEELIRHLNASTLTLQSGEIIARGVLAAVGLVVGIVCSDYVKAAFQVLRKVWELAR